MTESGERHLFGFVDEYRDEYLFEKIEETAERAENPKEWLKVTSGTGLDYDEYCFLDDEHSLDSDEGYYVLKGTHLFLCQRCRNEEIELDEGICKYIIKTRQPLIEEKIYNEDEQYKDDTFDQAYARGWRYINPGTLSLEDHMICMYAFWDQCDRTNICNISDCEEKCNKGDNCDHRLCCGSINCEEGCNEDDNVGCTNCTTGFWQLIGHSNIVVCARHPPPDDSLSFALYLYPQFYKYLTPTTTWIDLGKLSFINYGRKLGEDTRNCELCRKHGNWILFGTNRRRCNDCHVSIKPVTITNFQWGSIDVYINNEHQETFKDAKIWFSGAKKWDWSETGTRHKPGIQPADGQELIDLGVTTLILSRGVDLVLQVPKKTITYFEDRGITVHTLQSTEAFQLFNKLSAQGEKIGILLHSTC